MPVVANISSLFHNLLRKQRVEQDLDDEIRSHLELLIQEKIRKGTKPEEAARAAKLELGGIEQIKEQVRGVRAGVWLETLLQDLRFVMRLLRKDPGFTAIAVATLVLGIGANTAIFSLVNTVLLKPFAYPDAERIVMFQNTFRRFASTGSAAPTEFNWWRQQTEAFEYTSAYDFNVANLTGDSFPEQIPTMRVSADFFRLCGANALHGRTFMDADDLPRAPKTAVLSYSFWQRHFSGNPEVIGRQITLSGETHEIIGVVGPDLKAGQIAEQSLLSGDIEIDQPPDVYLPFQLDPNSAERGHYFNVAGRLKPGVTLAAANAQLQASYPEYARKWPDVTPGAGFGVQLLQHVIVGGVRTSLLILWSAVGLVLLIACANVANLLLVRGTARKREFAIRAAVGAGRRRIVRQLLTESVLLSVAGGVLGLAAGYAGIRAILSLIPGKIPRIGEAGSNVSLDWRVLAFTMGLSILTGILFGLIPALRSSREDLDSTLKESSSRSGTGLRHDEIRTLLVTTEMALAIVLLIGAMLLVRSFIAIRQVNPGFDAHNVLTMRMSLTGPQFEKSAAVTKAIEEGVRRIRALPGVEVAASTCCVPLEDRLHAYFQIAGRPESRASGGSVGWALVSPGYFETFKIPVLRGRGFTERDDRGPPVIIINQTLAKQLWPDSDPLNDQLVSGHESPRQIIGVVGDVRDDTLNRVPRPIVYELAAHDTGLLSVTTDVPWAWVIRTRAAPMSLSSAIQNELREASGGLPVANIRTMEETLSRSTATEEFNTLVLTIFGFSALLLASLGIYGVISYSMAQRMHEIGIRMALGAERSDVFRMVISQGLRLALVGLAIGTVAALILARLLSSFSHLLYGVTTDDPLTFIGAPLVLTAVAALACYVPARRATRVDPAIALRWE